MIFNINNFHEYSGFITAVDAYGNTGLGSSLFKFDGAKRPKSPNDLKAIFNPETSSILCKWEDLTIPNVRYNLYYTTLTVLPKRDDLWSTIMDIKEPHKVLGGRDVKLVYNKQYTIKITAVSKYGLESRPSNLVSLVTRDPLPQAPFNITNNQIENDTSMKIKWNYNGNDTRKFILSVECEKCNQPIETFQSTKMEYIIRNLELGAYYKVKIIAISKNTGREGPTSAPFRFLVPDRTPLPPPVDLRAKSTQTEILLSWKFNGDRTKLSHFRIIMDKADDGSGQVGTTVEVPADRRTHNFENLSRGAQYVINMYTIGTNGAESQSKPHHVTTKSVYNATIDTVKVMAGAGSVQVRWKAPNKINNRDISYYQIRYSKIDENKYTVTNKEKNRKGFGLR